MRTLIYTAFVSLDGVVDSPGGGTAAEAHRSGGWTYKDIEFLPEAYELKGRETEEATALMFGRASYEAFAPVWPGMEDFAALKDLPKYVVSTTLGQDALVDNWGDITILRSLEDVAKVKETDGGPIVVHGSATLARNLSDSRPHRPLPPACLPRAAGSRQADVQRHRQGQADAEGARVRDIRQRHHEDRL